MATVLQRIRQSAERRLPPRLHGCLVSAALIGLYAEDALIFLQQAIDHGAGSLVQL
jgi:hypothetical protein